MKSTSVLDEDFRHFSEVSEYKNEFNVADYAGKVFNMFSGEQEEITLQCSNDILEQVIDRFSDKIFIRSSEDKSFVFTTKAFISDGLVSWIMQFGEKMKVKSPDFLVKKILDKTRDINSNY